MAKKVETITTSSSSLGKSVVKPCTCSNAYQDKAHGKGRRVMNVGNKKYTCTVCGTVKS